MRNVPVKLGERSYDILIEPGISTRVGEHLKDLAKGKKLLVVTDRTVGPLFGPPLAKSLQVAGFDGSLVELPPGEGAKSLDVAKFLYDRCLEIGLDRSSILVALGGGVLGDLTGFVAATYMRGISFVQVPTTLLAMVDASVGGKTAVDHPKAKNVIGAFHQPLAVLIDPLTLGKLPERDLKSGLAEVIKYGVLDDAEFFGYLEANIGRILQREPEVVGTVIQRCCEIKARIVSEDECEAEGGPRALLNFGHTFAHAIETCCNYQGYLHGEAVAIGMVLAANLSAKRQLLSQEEAQRIRSLIERAGLPVSLKQGDPENDALHAATFRDKKARDGRLRFVLAEAIGKTKVFEDVSDQDARRIWEEAVRI